MISNADPLELNHLISSIRHKLIGEVIPELRAVFLKFDNQTYTVTFYHHEQLTPVIEQFYKKIFEKAMGDIRIDPEKVKIQIVYLPYPSALPQNQHVVYQRKEPFEDPSENDSKEAFEKYRQWKHKKEL